MQSHKTSENILKIYLGKWCENGKSRKIFLYLFGLKSVLKGGKFVTRVTKSTADKYSFLKEEINGKYYLIVSGSRLLYIITNPYGNKLIPKDLYLAILEGLKNNADFLTAFFKL